MESWTERILVSSLWERYLTGIAGIVSLALSSQLALQFAHLAFRPLRTREEEHSFIYGDILEEACDISDYDQNTTKWTPSGLNKEAVSKLLQNRVNDMLKVSGPNNDAVRRIKQLEKQFPLHDVEPEKCHQLSPGEIDRWENLHRM